MTTSSQADSAVTSAPTVAVVGSGPSGCFLAQMLRKQWPDAQITVFDRLPVPFGLVRYGVAPDHQHTKRIVDRFTRVFEDGRTHFAGNVHVGRDVSVDELRSNFHVVVLAAGIAGDRPLAVPGDGLSGVYGAGQMMRWINAHPDEVGFSPDLGRETVIVGNGNVAIDVLRTLIKDAPGFIGSDLSESAFTCLQRSRPQRIHLVGRSTADLAKFDAAMIRELAGLERASFEVDGLSPETETEKANSKVRTLIELAELHRPQAEVEVVFHFGWRPAEVHGDDQVTAMSFVRSDDGAQTLRLPADSVVTAIGFTTDPADALSVYATKSDSEGADDSRVADGLYACGWFRRGPTGGIPANRACAKEVASHIAADIDEQQLGHRPGFDGVNAEVRARAVDFGGWQKIDSQETAEGDERRIRHKIEDIAALLAAAELEPEPQSEGCQYETTSNGVGVSLKSTQLVMGR